MGPRERLARLDSRQAIFSPDRRLRYTLTRTIQDEGWKPVLFIGMNPSTADETVNDPTVRRCMGFVRSWDRGKLYVGNVCPIRATDPFDLRSAPLSEAEMDENIAWLRTMASDSNMVVAAWGAFLYLQPTLKPLVDRVVAEVLDQFPAFHLGLTYRGYPRHPLYLPKDTEPVLWRP